MIKRAQGGVMKNKYNFGALLIFSLSFILISCKGGGEHQVKDNPVVKTNHIPAPEFNADSAYNNIKTQVAFGPRVLSTTAHDNCEKYFTEKLKALTTDVVLQRTEVTTFDGKRHRIVNIIASFYPEIANRVLLCSHWDTRPFADQDSVRKKEPIDGAIDGGSGCGILLEIARLLQKNKPNIGVDIILLDAEDYGQPEDSLYPPQQNTYGLGSQYWSTNLHKPGYFANYGILLDMVGAKGSSFTMEGFSMQYASAIVKKVWDIGSRLGYSDYFQYTNTNSIYDDHYYINPNTHIPTIDINDYAVKTKSHFGAYWHTHQDNMEMVDTKTLKAVGQTLMEVLFSE